ncbi:MAG: alpha/beta hydrolase [Bacteroidota bacterium]
MKNPKWTVVALLCGFLSGQIMTRAQSSEVLYIWPDKVPGEAGPKHDPVQTENTSGNVMRITDITNPALLMFRPDPLKDRKAGIIVCPGGGYNILAIDKEGYEIAEWLAEQGFHAFVLQYRVPQKQLGALADLQRSLRIVRSQAADKGLDVDKVGVLGFSAGGHLCASASTRFDSAVYDAADPIDTLSCRPDFALLVYPAYLDRGEQNSLSPDLVLTPQTPPMFLFATADDRHANSSLVMASALRWAGISVECHLLPAGGHGYGMRSGNSAAETWPQLAKTWLQEVIKK